MILISKKKALGLLVLFVFSFCFSCIYAQNVSFTTTAPNAVIKGEQFRLTYTLENANGSDLKFASTIKGFDILFGPSVSTSSITRIINGQRSSSSSEAYTFILSATSEGTFTLPGASIIVDGKTYSSKSVQVKVLPPDKNSTNNQQQSPSNRGAAGSSTTSAGFSTTDAFIRAIVSKTKIYEQEAFVVTFRLYTTYEVRNIGNIEFPEFNNFMIEDQTLSPTRQLQPEHYNGRNYYTADLRRVLLFAQKSGNIQIPSGKIQMVFNVPSKTIQTFFGPQYIMSDVTKELKTNPLTIKVLPLPENKPVSYANAVGSFNLSSTLTSTHIKANEAITLKLDLTGTGNMKLIKTPELILPKEFEVYDPKITNNFKFSDNGLTGTKSIEYLFIPRYPGKYTIPVINFSYFDPASGQYKTLKTPEYSITVDKDPNAVNQVVDNAQSAVKAIDDIRYIKQGKHKFENINNFIFGSVLYWLCYIIPFLLLIIALFIYRKRIKENADLNALRNKRANKIAVKRLKLAAKYLADNNKESFYEEVLRATWGYLSDKLTIPVSELNRDNIEHELINFGGSRELINKFIYVLDTCEFARYAPAESETAMDDLYKDAVDAIGEMENFKKNKNNN